MNKFLILLVYIYKYSIGQLFPPSCRFQPTCTNYMVDSINKHGSFRGSYNGIKRIFRCHPLSRKFGYDPVE